MNWIILAAGGNGTRARQRSNKIFALIEGKSILHWTLWQLERTPCIHRVVILARKNDMLRVKNIIGNKKCTKVHAVLPASSSRQQSTFSALKYLQGKAEDNDLIGVHNAVNPFVTPEEIASVFHFAQVYGAALLAKPAVDTIKVATISHFVRSTPPRKTVWHAQTPQVALYSKLWKAFQKASIQRFSGTDDAQLLERIGMRVKIVPCSNTNFKITFPEDILLAKHIMKNIRGQYYG